MSIFLQILIFSMGVNLFFFFLAYFLKTDKFTDITYSLTFVIIALVLGIRSGGNIYFQLMCLAVILWGFRLGGYLLYRIFKIKKDSRFDEMRGNFLKYLSFWLLQGFTVWVVSLSLISVFNKISIFGDSSMQIFTNRLYFYQFLLGLLIWAEGLIIETVADIQQFKFKGKLKNKNKWIDTGLWEYSRHPNYFGEILCWFGLFLSSQAFFDSINFVGLLSPLYITLLIVFVSGIPLLEKKNNERYKGDSDYKKYVRETSILIPWFKKK